VLTFARTSSLSVMYRDHFSDMHISISVSCSLLNASVVNGRGETQSTLVPFHEFKMILGLLVSPRCCGSFFKKKKLKVVKEVSIREKTLMLPVGVNRCL
jgi:hypothetical protein